MGEEEDGREVQAEVFECPVCGSSVAAEDKKCLKCGAEFDEDEDEAASPQPEAPVNRYLKMLESEDAAPLPSPPTPPPAAPLPDVMAKRVAPPYVAPPPRLPPSHALPYAAPAVSPQQPPSQLPPQSAYPHAPPAISQAVPPQPQPSPAPPPQSPPPKTNVQQTLEQKLAEIEAVIKEDLEYELSSSMPQKGFFETKAAHDARYAVWLDMAYRRAKRSVVIAGVENSGKTDLMIALYSYFMAGTHNGTAPVRVIHGHEYLQEKLAARRRGDTIYKKNDKGELHPMVVKLGADNRTGYFVIWDISGEDFSSEPLENVERAQRANPSVFFKDNISDADAIAVLIDVVRSQEAITRNNNLPSHIKYEVQLCPDGHPMILNVPENTKYSCANGHDVKMPAFNIIKITKQSKRPPYCTIHNEQLEKKENTYRCPKDCKTLEEETLDWTEETNKHMNLQCLYIAKLINMQVVPASKLQRIITKSDVFMDARNEVAPFVKNLCKKHTQSDDSAMPAPIFTSSRRALNGASSGGIEEFVSFLYGLQRQ